MQLYEQTGTLHRFKSIYNLDLQYRGELELSFRTLGSIGISGGRILIRYLMDFSVLL